MIPSVLFSVSLDIINFHAENNNQKCWRTLIDYLEQLKCKLYSKLASRIILKYDPLAIILFIWLDLYVTFAAKSYTSVGKLTLTNENLSWLSESQILSLTVSHYLETCGCVLSLILFRSPTHSPTSTKQLELNSNLILYFELYYKESLFTEERNKHFLRRMAKIIRESE